MKHEEIIFSLSGKYFFTSKYMCGKSLKDHIENKCRFSEKQILHFFKTLITTLNDLLSEGIVHYAVTPDHILVKSVDGKLEFYIAALEHTVEFSNVKLLSRNTYDGKDYTIQLKNIGNITKEMHYQNYAYALSLIALQLLSAKDISDISNPKLKDMELKRQLSLKNISKETCNFFCLCLSGKATVEEFDKFLSQYLSSKIKLSDLHIQDRIVGESRFGKVHLGFDDNSMVAIKEFKIDPSKEAIKNIKIIQQILSNSKYIVQIKHYLKEKGKSYIVMNYFEGGNLSQIVNEQGLTLEQVRIIAWDVASALFEMHIKNFVHTDVKFDNIFLNTTVNKAILIDLDSAQQANKPIKGFGTPGYMAPEVKKGLQGADPKKADIYSFGIVLQKMCNSLSTGGEEFMSEAKDLIAKCTCEDFKARISIKKVLNHSFFTKLVQIGSHPPPSMKLIKDISGRKYFEWESGGVVYTIIQYENNKTIERSLLMWKNCEQLDSISKIKEIFSHDKFIYAKIPKIEDSDSLRSIVEKAIKEDAMKIREILSKKIIYLLLKTIEDLHLLHISHRSLDPDVIYVKDFMGNNTQAFVTEMDVAKSAFVDRSISGKDKPKAFYAPEFFIPSEKNNFDLRKLDIWSFGVLCYYMLSMKEPCESDEKSVLKFYHNPEKIDWSLVRDSYKKIILQCLQRDPSKRPTVQFLLEFFLMQYK